MDCSNTYITNMVLYTYLRKLEEQFLYIFFFTYIFHLFMKIIFEHTTALKLFWKNDVAVNNIGHFIYDIVIRPRRVIWDAMPLNKARDKR